MNVHMYAFVNMRADLNLMACFDKQILKEIQLQNPEKYFAKTQPDKWN